MTDPAPADGSIPWLVGTRRVEETRRIAPEAPDTTWVERLLDLRFLCFIFVLLPARIHPR